VDPGGTGRARQGTIEAMSLPVLPLHMGALHPFEQLLVMLLAFGPFVALGIVIAVRRRQDRREEQLARDQRQGQRDR
jgi:Na+-translocating ferredoxin:NAD+ oxidoreductase RnfE subunit